MNAIKEYENNKWKFIGQKVGKPAKACEQYAKEHFPGKNYPRQCYLVEYNSLTWRKRKGS